MLLTQSKTSETPAVEEPLDPRKTVSGILVGRAVEVLETARRYYPAQVAELERRLGELIQSGTLKGPITGEELYSFLRQIGLNFSMDVKIRVREGGKLKTLEEKLRSKG